MNLNQKRKEHDKPFRIEVNKGTCKKYKIKEGDSLN